MSSETRTITAKEELCNKLQMILPGFGEVDPKEYVKDAQFYSKRANGENAFFCQEKGEKRAREVFEWDMCKCVRDPKKISEITGEDREDLLVLFGEMLGALEADISLGLSAKYYEAAFAEKIVCFGTVDKELAMKAQHLLASSYILEEIANRRREILYEAGLYFDDGTARMKLEEELVKQCQEKKMDLEQTDSPEEIIKIIFGDIGITQELLDTRIKEVQRD